MPTLCIFNGIKILMYYREHTPPHFHAERADEEAEIGIDPIMILEGSLKRRRAPKYLNGLLSIRLNCAPIGNLRALVCHCCRSRH